MTPMERHLTREILRAAVIRQISCPTCKRILDTRRAVELDFYRAAELAGVKVLCSSCYDAKCAQGKLAAQMADTGFTVETIDGRELFGTIEAIDGRELEMPPFGGTKG